MKKNKTYSDTYRLNWIIKNDAGLNNPHNGNGCHCYISKGIYGEDTQHFYAHTYRQAIDKAIKEYK